MTVEKILVVNNVFEVIGTDVRFNLNLSRDCHIATQHNIKKAMQQYAKLKCQELLEIVADKAKIIDEDGDVYQQPHIFFCNGEAYKNWVDKDSILNAVALDDFIV